MDKSTTSNKMKDLHSDNKVKIKFNMNMHGFRKDQVVQYKSLPNDKQILVRRRLADNDNSVEVVEKPKSRTAQNKSNNNNTGK